MQSGKMAWKGTDKFVLVTQSGLCLSVQWSYTCKDNANSDVLPRDPELAPKNLHSSKQVSKNAYLDPDPQLWFLGPFLSFVTLGVLLYEGSCVR